MKLKRTESKNQVSHIENPFSERLPVENEVKIPIKNAKESFNVASSAGFTSSYYQKMNFYDFTMEANNKLPHTKQSSLGKTGVTDNEKSLKAYQSL